MKGKPPVRHPRVRGEVVKEFLFVGNAVASIAAVHEYGARGRRTSRFLKDVKKIDQGPLETTPSRISPAVLLVVDAGGRSRCLREGGPREPCPASLPASSQPLTRWTASGSGAGAVRMATQRPVPKQLNALHPKVDRGVGFAADVADRDVPRSVGIRTDIATLQISGEDPSTRSVES